MGTSELTWPQDVVALSYWQPAIAIPTSGTRWSGIVSVVSSPLAEFVSLLLHRSWRTFDETFSSLLPSDLIRSAKSDSNSVGWLGWHIGRSYDRNGAELMGVPQLWVVGWSDQFALPPDPAATGFGQPSDAARQMRWPPPAVIVDYHDAVMLRLVTYVDGGRLGDPDRLVESPTLGNMATAGQRLVGMVTDSLLHLGQLSAALDQ